MFSTINQAVWSPGGGPGGSRPANLPDVFEHVEHLGRQVGIGHVELCKVGLQNGGRRLLRLQDGRFLLEAQDPGEEEEEEREGGEGRRDTQRE